jgi:hypothetical protein
VEPDVGLSLDRIYLHLLQSFFDLLTAIAGFDLNAVDL